MKLLSAMYLFVYCVFYDYFKYPSNFIGLQINRVDLLQVGTAFSIVFLSVGVLIKKPRSIKANSIIVISCAAIYAITWILAIFSFDPSVAPVSAADSSQLRVSDLDELLKAFKFFVAYIYLPFLMAQFLSGDALSNIIYAAAFFHLTWAIHQIMYFWGFVHVDLLPIGVGWRIDDSTFNYVYGRSSGLLTNQFNYSFFMQLAALLALFRSSCLKSKKELMLFGVFLFGSLLSLNRTTLILWVVFVAFMGLSLEKGSGKIKVALALLIVISIVGITLNWEQLNYMIERRLEGDVSINTRLNGYMMAASVATASPVFGAGMGHGLITDSTISTLIIESGIVGLLGWLIFWCSVLWVALSAMNKLKSVNGVLEVHKANARTLFWMVLFIIMGSFLVGNAERHPVLLSVIVLCFIVCNRNEKDFKSPKPGRTAPISGLT